MKKWKCPNCGELFDTIECKVEGTVILNTDNEWEDNDIETTFAECEGCHFEEDMWSDLKFEVVEV